MTKKATSPTVFKVAIGDEVMIVKARDRRQVTAYVMTKYPRISIDKASADDVLDATSKDLKITDISKEPAEQLEIEDSKLKPPATE